MYHKQLRYCAAYVTYVSPAAGLAQLGTARGPLTQPSMARTQAA